MRRTVLFSVFILLTISSTAAWADEIYVPWNTPTTGSTNIYPFSPSSSRTDWRYQLVFDAKHLKGLPVTITDIAFAPAFTGTLTTKKLEVRMSHTTAATSTNFAVNLPNPVQVLGKLNYTWNATQGKWSTFRLTNSFNYNGTDRLTIEIRYTGGFVKATSGSAGGCKYDLGYADRVWNYGTGTAFGATTGTLGLKSGLKIRITVNRAQVVPAGSAQVGTALAFNLLAPGEAGRTYQLGTSLGAGPIPVGNYQLGLSADAMLVASTSGFLSTVFQDYAGKLDANGQAVAKLHLPDVTALKGVRFYTAFVTVDSQASSGVSIVSPNVMVTAQ